MSNKNARVHFHVFSIDWDTDDIQLNDVDLPGAVDFDIDPAWVEQFEDDDEAIGEWLSSQYGWCVNSFGYTKTTQPKHSPSKKQPTDAPELDDIVDGLSKQLERVEVAHMRTETALSAAKRAVDGFSAATSTFIDEVKRAERVKADIDAFITDFNRRFGTTIGQK